MKEIAMAKQINSEGITLLRFIAGRWSLNKYRNGMLLHLLIKI
jgi:hypothetical protein